MSRVFLSFADSRMKPSLKRISKQAKNFGVYDKIIVADESYLDRRFRKKYKSELVFGSRGYGYWIWKPQILLQALSSMKEGDILQYTDAGCHLNINGKNRLLEYFALTEKSATGILAFQAKPPAPPLIYDGRQLLDLSDYRWTKGDLLDYFNVREREEIWKSQSVGATVIFVRKAEAALRIINDWLKVPESDFSLIDDTPSRSANLEGFVEHRHDQSIFSLLCKLNNVETISAYEYWYPSASCLSKKDFEALVDFPIHARRDKEFRLRIRAMKRLKSRLSRLFSRLQYGF
jgi:hypothetical protein